MDAPLLAARDLRVDARAPAGAVDGVTLAIDGPRAIVIGAGRALFEAACGVARPVRGAIELRGEACASALARGAIAGAPLDPPMPAEWSALDYATWSARLAGRSARDARLVASRALEDLGVAGALQGEKLAKATRAARRAAVLAAAIATGAGVIAFEDPTDALDDEAAHVVARFVAQALDAAKVGAWIAFAARAPLDSAIVQAADEAVVVAGDAVVARGKPSHLAWGARKYAVDAQGAGEALAAKLTARGARVESRLALAGWARFVVELPEGATTRDLFADADEVGAVVVELRPIGLAFA